MLNERAARGDTAVGVHQVVSVVLTRWKCNLILSLIADEMPLKTARNY